MSTSLYRLAYCSRNRLRGTEAEVAAQLEQILRIARSNNALHDLTGALLYTAGNFAQVLEGPVDKVGLVFEKIQRDCRHSQVVVIQNGLIDARDFPEWSMAFAGTTVSQPVASDAFGSAFAGTPGAGDEILSVLKDLVVEEDRWIIV